MQPSSPVVLIIFCYSLSNTLKVAFPKNESLHLIELRSYYMCVGMFLNRSTPRVIGRADEELPSTTLDILLVTIEMTPSYTNRGRKQD